MKTKQQIQDEIAALQKQLEEMKEYYYLRTDSKGLFTVSLIEDLIWVREGKGLCPHPDQPHGLGKFETREEAERCREALIGLLHIAKEHPLTLEFLSNGFYLVARGQRVIKAIEEGTYS